jgi:hypothetical protein
MHRSGTSCLTHALAAGGMHLGDELLEGTEADNLQGHAEAVEALAINEHILQFSGGAWDRPPSALHCDAESLARMDRFLGDLRRRPVAGWKDPRTVLTFPLWKPRLGDYRVVGCLRHPLSVAKSLAARESRPIEAGLALWETYNERLLEHLRAEDEFFLFDFDAGPAELQASTTAICRGLGLCTDGAVQSVFNPFLRHQACTEKITQPRLRALYHEIRELGRRRAANQNAAIARGTCASDDLASQLQHLARAHQLQNQVLQQIDERVKELEAHLIRLRANALYRAARFVGGLVERMWAPFGRTRTTPTPTLPSSHQQRHAA